MGKKQLGINPKVAEARQKKQQSQDAKKAQASQQKEDDYWAQHANPVAKRDMKKQAEEKRREEAERKRQEAKLLAQKEEAELARVGKKKQAPAKVTKREINQMKEAQMNMHQAMAEEREMARSRAVGVDEYASQLDVKIDNRTEAVVDARSLDEAVSQLTVTEDRHPEKRAKALFNEYFERRLPELKEEKPGLKLMQYKSKIFDEWLKHPDNPRNQMK